MFSRIFSGLDFYHVFYYFLLYSFIGWCWEVFYVYLRTGKVVNRGFLSGPFCPIYGFGASAVYIVLDPVANNNFAIFFGGMILATVLEYFTGTIMENLFHAKWWDYSDIKFNLKGRICLPVSIGWGFFSVIMMRIMHPAVKSVVAVLPHAVGNVLMYIIIGYFVADTISAAKAAFNLDKALARMEQAREELREKIENTKLYESKEELLAKIESTQREFEEFLKEKETLIDAKKAFYKEEISDRIEALSEKYPEAAQRTEEAIKNFKEGQAEFKEKLAKAGEELRLKHKAYVELMKPTAMQKRLLNAYPDLKSIKHNEALTRIREEMLKKVKEAKKARKEINKEN